MWVASLYQCKCQFSPSPPRIRTAISLFKHNPLLSETLKVESFGTSGGLWLLSPTGHWSVTPTFDRSLMIRLVYWIGNHDALQYPKNRPMSFIQWLNDPFAETRTRRMGHRVGRHALLFGYGEEGEPVPSGPGSYSVGTRRPRGTSLFYKWHRISVMLLIAARRFHRLWVSTRAGSGHQRDLLSYN